MPVTNWTTETSTDAAGRAIVTITVVDGQGRRYQQDWVSGTQAPPTVQASASSPAVVNEAAIAGAALVAAVNTAATTVPDKKRIPKPR